MGDSHSDGEMVSATRSSLLDLKPKHKLNYVDCEEPKMPKRTSSPRRSRQNTSKENLISFSITIDDPSKQRDRNQDSDDESDSTWYPPQHPIAKERNLRKRRERKRKPKEERWSYWMKQLPKDIEYCSEEKKYFMKQSVDVRKDFIEKEKHLLKEDDSIVPPRFRMLQLSDRDMDQSVRLMVLKKIDSWYAMEPTASEYGKMANWVQSFEKIPFGQQAPSIRSVIQQQNTDVVTYLERMKECMDNAVFAHEQAKEQIMEIIAKDYSNPNDTVASGFCVGIQGPAGNGKTTLIKEGIAKAMNRPFCLIGLGGAKNSNSFVGHDYTYEGGTYGRILQALMLAKVMNPIIYFDELDKLSEDSQGEEIANLLCHLTDPSQNTLFEDKYFSGIPIDLSRVMFIFSFNDESKINPILKDRIQMIRTEGLTPKQKIHIVRNYILPEVKRELPSVSLTWNDSVISHIIEYFTRKEKGVRNLKRAIFTICRKVNLHTILGGNVSLFTKSIIPGEKGVVTKEMVEEYLKSEKSSTIRHGYI